MHIVKQLHNYNIHIGSSVIDYTEKTKRTFGTFEDFAKSTGYEYIDRKIVITNLEIAEFNKLEDAKYSLGYRQTTSQNNLIIYIK